jgi:perosamine synthetase
LKKYLVEVMKISSRIKAEANRNSEKREVVAWWRVDLDDSDVREVALAVQAGNVSMGCVTEELEKNLSEILGVKYVVATTSGSTALLMSMIAIGIKAGDEVIIPNRTWIATAHAVSLLGGKVILADVLPDRPVLDAFKLESYINEKTKAIIPVPLNGRAVNMEEVWRIAKKYKLMVVEDGAQSLLCPYKERSAFIGTGSDMGCFSLGLTKLVSAGQGGFIATNSAKHYKDLKKIRMHGVDSLFECRYSRLGQNFRITDMQSALAISQLKKVNNKIEKLWDLYKSYEACLKEKEGVALIPVDISRGEIPLYIEIMCQDRGKVQTALAREGIESKAFYPNLNQAEYLKSGKAGNNSNSFELNGLTLPSGPDQDKKVVHKIEKILNSIR